MTARLEIFPGEYALGYQGRLMKFNDIKASAFSVENFKPWLDYKDIPLTDLSVIEFLAKVADLSVASFLSDHSLVRLRRVFRPLLPKDNHEILGLHHSSKDISLRNIRRNAFFCVKCIEEDVERVGISFWRREHQLPGCFSCHCHGGALSFVKAHEAFRHPPSKYYKDHYVVNPGFIKGIKSFESIPRFLAINRAVLSRSRRLNHAILAEVLKTQVQKIGIHAGDVLKRDKALSDFVKKSFNLNWLAEIFPRSNSQPSRHVWPPVNRALLPRKTGLQWAVYAILFAAAFDSVDEAIELIFASSVADPTDVQASKIVEFTIWELRDAYLQCINRQPKSALSLI